MEKGRETKKGEGERVRESGKMGKGYGKEKRKG